MLKLVSPQPRAASRKTRKRENAFDRARRLRHQIQEDQALGQATQRAIAVGRRTIIEAQCCLQRVLSGHVANRASPLSARDQAHIGGELANRLQIIHQRLVLFSSSVEFEIDHLEMLWAEVEELVGHARAGKEKS